MILPFLENVLVEDVCCLRPFVKLACSPQYGWQPRSYLRLGSWNPQKGKDMFLGSSEIKKHTVLAADYAECTCIVLCIFKLYTCIYLYDNVWITYYVLLIRFKFHPRWWWTPSRSRDRSGADNFSGHVRELWGSQVPPPMLPDRIPNLRMIARYSLLIY